VFTYLSTEDLEAPVGVSRRTIVQLTSYWWSQPKLRPIAVCL